MRAWPVSLKVGGSCRRDLGGSSGLEGTSEDLRTPVNQVPVGWGKAKLCLLYLILLVLDIFTRSARFFYI